MGFVFDSTRTASDLVFNGHFEQYPNIPWIFTHGGGTLPLMAERMELFRSVFASSTNTSPGTDPAGPVPEQISRLWFDTAGTPFPYQVPAVASAFGTERLLYGSDFCFTPATGAMQQIASIDAAPQPDGGTWRTRTTRNAPGVFAAYAAGLPLAAGGRGAENLPLRDAPERKFRALDPIFAGRRPGGVVPVHDDLPRVRLFGHLDDPAWLRSVVARGVGR
ncbi:hypothetical protein GCM10010230_25700 [Streptomyces narbonensis]|uniref:amidohydrolase family protein n=1 Tax=Streptomyces narbonensis TaxID=67333 RepID=UPI0019C2B555|nr:amidohydrolase family protein [Streptomyces narbonensis]GGV99480.1 hypothetical protein GCM10010230_25700 [Streptomyces narbonensis]